MFHVSVFNVYAFTARYILTKFIDYNVTKEYNRSNVNNWREETIPRIFPSNEIMSASLNWNTNVLEGNGNATLNLSLSHS